MEVGTVPESRRDLAKKLESVKEKAIEMGFAVIPLPE
jgi:hypothetical protein